MKTHDGDGPRVPEIEYEEECQTGECSATQMCNDCARIEDERRHHVDEDVMEWFEERARSAREAAEGGSK